MNINKCSFRSMIQEGNINGFTPCYRVREFYDNRVHAIPIIFKRLWRINLVQKRMCDAVTLV